MNDYLDSNKTKYTLADVETSLNYGRPFSKIQRRVIYGVIAMLVICCITLLVGALVGFFVDQLEVTVLLIFAAVFVFCAGFIAFVVWTLSKCNKNENLIKDCFNDAVEVDAYICREPYMSKSGNDLNAYVAHFNLDNVEYAVTYQKAPLSSNDRKDLAFFVNKHCSALYSPKHNDVIILKPQQDEEIL